MWVIRPRFPRLQSIFVTHNFSQRVFSFQKLLFWTQGGSLQNMVNGLPGFQWEMEVCRDP